MNHKNPPMPHDRPMFRFMITFALCCKMGEAHGWGTFPYCGPGLGYLTPPLRTLILRMPHPGALPTLFLSLSLSQYVGRMCFFLGFFVQCANASRESIPSGPPSIHLKDKKSLHFVSDFPFPYLKCG
jgi:hypothetical protein